jgi:hypothetical protein
MWARTPLLLVLAALANKATAARLPLKALAHLLLAYPQPGVVEAVTTTPKLVALEVLAAAVAVAAPVRLVRVQVAKATTVAATLASEPLAVVAVAGALWAATLLGHQLLVTVALAHQTRLQLDRQSFTLVVAAVPVSLETSMDQAASAVVVVLLAAVEQQTLAVVVAPAFQAGAHGRLPATAALELSSLDIGLRNGSFCTNQRTRHGVDSHRGKQQRHLGRERPRVRSHRQAVLHESARRRVGADQLQRQHA